MTTITGTETFQSGSHTSTAKDVTTLWQANTYYAIFYDTSKWLPTDTCSGTIEFSPDGGTTWGWGCGETTSGGTRTTSKGNPWGCGCSTALPGRPAMPTPDNWPANPATVLVRVNYTVPSRQTNVTVSITLIS